MLDPTAVKTMVESGHATIAHLAAHFDVPIWEIKKFLSDQDIPEPRCQDAQYRYMRKLESVQRVEPADWESLVFDDDQHRWVNGIDTLTTDGAVKGNEILQRYHGELRCCYTNEPTDVIMAIDGNPQNFLVTNLVPITEGVIRERFSHVPLFVAGKTYRFEPEEKGPKRFDIELGIHLQQRLDTSFGAAFKEDYVDALVSQWVIPYFNLLDHDKILGPGIPPTPELFALWAWRQLSTVALLKGLARVEVKIGDVAAFVTKDSYLQMVVGLLQRAVQSRAVASQPSRIITPQQAAAMGQIPPGPQMGVIAP